MIHTDPTKRHEFVLLFDVTNGNPNGDPDAGNLPRIDPETMHGLVTDVCIKRKVRDYVAGVLGKPIFIQSETALNTLIYQAAREVGVEAPQTTIESETVLEWLRENPVEDFELDGETLRFIGEKWNQKTVRKNLLANVEDDNLQRELKNVANRLEQVAKGKTISRKDRAKTREKLIETRYDIRMFGAVLSTGLNAGQVRGPMQLTFAKSINPIFGMDVPITRVAITREEDMGKETEMGRKAIVPYGLYRAHGFYNPFLARRKTDKNDWEYFVTSEDVSCFWEALEKMFEFDHSAARGEIVTQGLYIFTHENEKGNAPAHKLFERITPELKDREKPPRRFEDYTITVNDKDLPQGVTLTRLVG